LYCFTHKCKKEKHGLSDLPPVFVPIVKLETGVYCF
jgi:hypothetical protein